MKKPAENHTVHWREFCGFHGCFVTVLLGVPLGASKVNWGQLLNTYRFVASPPCHIFQPAWQLKTSTAVYKGEAARAGFNLKKRKKNVIVKITRLPSCTSTFDHAELCILFQFNFRYLLKKMFQILLYLMIENSLAKHSLLEFFCVVSFLTRHNSWILFVL